jgi:hypothetical protein
MPYCRDFFQEKNMEHGTTEGGSRWRHMFKSPLLTETRHQRIVDALFGSTYDTNNFIFPLGSFTNDAGVFVYGHTLSQHIGTSLVQPALTPLMHATIPIC